MPKNAFSDRPNGINTGSKTCVCCIAAAAKTEDSGVVLPVMLREPHKDDSKITFLLDFRLALLGCERPVLAKSSKSSVVAYTPV